MFETLFFKGFALCSIITLSTPLEVLKIRMQTNSELLLLGRITQKYHSFMNCFKTIVKNEGMSGLWKGNTVSMARVLPLECINYYTRKTLQQHFSNQLLNNVFISIISGITASTIMYPTDILRQFLNNQTSARLSFADAFKKIVQEYGYKYFFKGYTNLILTTMVYRGCYNGFYDTHKVSVNSWLQRAKVAYLSTIMAELVVYPIQIIRRRRIVVNAKEGLLRYGHLIWKNEGLRGFYKGAAVVPIQSLTWGMVLIIFDTAGIGFEVSFEG